MQSTKPPSSRPGLLVHVPTSESVKCQAVVDALSRQLPPHCSLGHIQGGDLARREPTAVRNLLDIFSVLYHMPLMGEAGDGNGGESEGEGEGREGQRRMTPTSFQPKVSEFLLS